MDGRIRKSVEMEIGEEQQKFRKGRGMTETAGGEEVGGAR